MNWLLPSVAALCTALFTTPAVTLTLEFPAGAHQTAEQVETYGSYRVPISGYENGEVQNIWAEGEVRQSAWQVQSQGLTTLQLMGPLKSQIESAGFEVIFECESRACGGFDFRYETDVLPEPAMHVDLGDFRFIAAHKMGEERPEYVSLLVSRSSGRGFLQITRVGPAEAEADVLVASTKNPDPLTLSDEIAAAAAKTSPSANGDPATTSTAMPLTQQLEIHGRAVLADLDFPTGSSRLGEGDYRSLDQLAGYLKAHPKRAIVLVGHTDAEGSLLGNKALSQKRAGSVRSKLTALGVAPGQVQAEGVGYLSPLTSNLTEEGREANRRVEVILSSTE
ncbi:OmpA family protein [Vannielia sp.]|uniref:OmpA family protein n=1 Tax=Vannielia sp. TaxID=2813045 RepID=UPI00263937ED|nr:OmpA family protein [Vannielia sp.]MDF1873588.1 OmpA family protein [Vannielia sp.]